MGALVTVEPMADSAVLDLPWVVTFGPLDDDEEWEPVVCGPYERPHALALARAVVEEDDLMAVVEPVLPRVTVEEIRDAIAEAQREALDEQADAERGPGPPAVPGSPPAAEEVRAGFARIAARLV